MVLTDEVKAYISTLSYKDMLKRWRFGAIGDPIFQGESGNFWVQQMEIKRNFVDHAGISKELGWGEGREDYAIQARPCFRSFG